MSKTNPLNDKDMVKFIKLQKTKPESEKSWSLKLGDIDKTTYDLSVKNPNVPEEAPLRSLEDILAEMKVLDEQTESLLNSIQKII